jgi:hypothetical protein
MNTLLQAQAYQMMQNRTLAMLYQQAMSGVPGSSHQQPLFAPVSSGQSKPVTFVVPSNYIATPVTYQMPTWQQPVLRPAHFPAPPSQEIPLAPVKINKKRPLVQRSSEKSSATDDDAPSEKKQNDLSEPSPGLVGERRLVISFEHFGTVTDNPQTFGKNGVLIPDGLRGTHKVYNEYWRFEIVHESEIIDPDGLKCKPITWKVTNLNNNVTHSLTETPSEAISRACLGRTITNKVFREALEYRAAELEVALNRETSEFRRANLQALIKLLRPKRFSIGPLVFGLQHKIVQDKMKPTSAEQSNPETAKQ